MVTPRFAIIQPATGLSIPPDNNNMARPAVPIGIPPGPGIVSEKMLILWRTSTRSSTSGVWTLTFVSGNGVTEYMSLFTADAFTGEPIACNEGKLVWVNKEDVVTLNIWEGDKIFFRLLNERTDFFSLKLVYDGHDKLVSASLDGREMEL